jgi:hypothetical protein
MMDPMSDYEFLVDGRPASLIDVRGAVVLDEPQRVTADHPSLGRQVSLGLTPEAMRHIYVSRTNAVFDGYSVAALNTKPTSFFHYVDQWAAPYPQNFKRVMSLIGAGAFLLSAALLGAAAHALLTRRRLPDMRLRQLRTEREMSQRELAAKAEISREYLTRLEAAHQPHARDVRETGEGPQGEGDGAVGMTAVDHEQLKRDCSDALEAHLREQRVDNLADLAEALRTLGPPYRFHGELMHGALRDGQENAITWHLIQVLEKLEAGR